MGISHSVRKTYGIGVCIILLLVTPSILAQELNPRLTIFSSGSFLEGARSFTMNGDPFRSEFATGAKIGFRGTVDVADNWALEATYSHGSNNLRIVNLAAPPAVERGFGTRVHQLTGNVLYFVSPAGDRVRVFGTVGMGLSRFSPTDAARTLAAHLAFIGEPAVISSNNAFNFNMGGGIEAKVNDRWGVRVDLRDHISPIPRFGVPQTATGPGVDFFPVDGTVHNAEVSVGVVIYLR
jgi:hypothetical protein